MMNINLNRIKFYQFLNEDIGRDELESWIYSNKNLENEFSEDHYFDLITFPYKTGDVEAYVTKIVKTFFDYKEYQLWRTTKLLEQISLGQIETVLASRRLRKLYKDQEGTLDSPLITMRLGIGFESVLDACPLEHEYAAWDSNALKDNLKIVELYKDDLIFTARIELEELRSNEVKSIDMSFVRDNKHLHSLFAQKLQFPKFYAHNWDALWDAITGLVEMPNQLILYNWNQFESEHPDDANRLYEMIAVYNVRTAQKSIKAKAGAWDGNADDI